MPCLSGLDRDDEHLSAENQRKRDTLIEMQMEGLGIRRCCGDHPTRDFKETKTGAGNGKSPLKLFDHSLIDHSYSYYSRD